MKFKINSGQLLLCLGFFISLVIASWAIKNQIWPSIQSTLQIKIGILSGIAVVSPFLTWLFRNKAALWIETIYERITPLVWLFGGLVLLSIPVVGYFAWSNQTGKTVSNNYIGPAVTDTDRPNIILITFDALTARDMSVYGYAKETTPFISEWAKSASLFTRNEAASNYTASTTASLMTGKQVWTHRRYQLNGGKTIRSDIESLPLLLKEHGYYNMAFIANHIASVQELGMAESFTVAPPANEFISPASLYGFFHKHLHKLFGNKIQLYDWILQEDFILHKVSTDKYMKYPYDTEFPLERIFDVFISEVNSNTSWKPYFAWIHVYPPHFPYLAPEGYVGLFDSSQKYRTAKSQDNLVRPRFYVQEQQHEADIIRARYDEFIRYCDKEFQDFIKQLETRDFLRNTIVILSSDHGESFEHGFFTHGGPFLFEQETNIPLIIKEPGQTEGKVFNDVVSQIDTTATILDFAGIKIPSWIEGRSLLPLMRGEKLPSRPVFSMIFDKVPVENRITKGTVAVWDGDYKLIHLLDNNKSLLFNLKEDLGELNDLYEKEPEVSRRLLNLISENIDKANKRIINAK